MGWSQSNRDAVRTFASFRCRKPAIFTPCAKCLKCTQWGWRRSRRRSLLSWYLASIDRIKRDLDDRNTIAYVEEDIRFHNLIAAATGNSELCRMLENISQKSALCRSKTYRLVAAASPDCHDNIYEALKEGDRELAQQAMREHIQFFRDTLQAGLWKRRKNRVQPRTRKPIWHGKPGRSAPYRPGLRQVIKLTGRQR